ncbi:hypothetical protein FQR65_LT17792 [Abscondita terminalis]|nr:hypothetical protein FQR65_LT17792 [Abscondita terminalis]
MVLMHQAVLSGVFAGDDGYQIKVKNNTDLKGAIITSTQTAENLKKNSLDTGTLTHSDIRNVSKSDEKGGKTPDTVLSTPNKIDQHASTTTGVSKSIGFGLDSDKDSSVTKSGINTSNITIRDEQGQQALTGKTAEQIKSDILTSVTTDTARENSGLSAPTSSGLGIATATLSPVASYEIGQYFKSKDAEGSTAHILAHTLLGAAVAATGGNDALTAGLSAGGAEATTPVLSNFLYGKDAKDLTADEKSTISAITGLVASGVGATTGDVASTVQSGNVAQNAVEDNLFGVLTADKKIDKQKNNYYFQALQACKSAECEKNIIMQNTLAAMQNVQKIISVSSTKYNEGDIITNPNDSTGLRYLVVNQNGSLKAKLLPADYQALYSVYELNSSRALVQGGALASIVANTLKSGHDVFADRSLFTNQEMTALSRTFAGVEVVGNVLMIGGAVAPKSIDLKAAANMIKTL